MHIARIVTNLSLDREFDYLIPERLRGLVHVGSRVRVRPLPVAFATDLPREARER